MKRTHIMLLAAFCVAGFAFRLWFAGLVPQPFVYDQEEYYGYALGILKHGLHADLYRLYGYPLIVAPIIAFFGAASPLPWTMFHAILDTITAFLVFWIARRVFKNPTPAWIAFILYLFNPFTAGYVGVLLSEIVTIFLVTLTSALILGKKSLWLVSLLLGFLPHVRPVFIALSVVALVVLVWSRPVKVKVLSFMLFCLPFLYTIAGNLVSYRQFSIVGVEPTFVRELYASLFIGRGLPFTDTKWGNWPVEAQNAWGAFSAPGDSVGRHEVADRYLAEATDIIRRDPAGFLGSRIAKMGYVWEKHFVYPYNQGKPTPIVKAMIYWGNIGLIGIGLIGLIGSIRRIRWFAMLTIFFIVYISAAHAFSTSEERFSLPAYPLIFLFAGYGIWRLIGCRKQTSAGRFGRSLKK